MKMSTHLWPCQRMLQELHSVYEDCDELAYKSVFFKKTIQKVQGVRDRVRGSGSDSSATPCPPLPDDAQVTSENSQIEVKFLLERLRTHIDVAYLEKHSSENIELPQFIEALSSITKQVRVGGLSDTNDVQLFKAYGIASFDCTGEVKPDLYNDWDITSPLSGNDGRDFRHYKNNIGTWLALPENLRVQMTTFIVNYFGTFDKNKGDDIVGVSNLIITPIPTNEAPVIQKLHLDHMWGAGNEVVVAIDISGKALKTRYFTGSQNIAEYSKNFNTRNNRGDRIFGDWRERGVACNAKRVADLLIKSIEERKATHYTEADKNGMIFDAGGLHSGNAVLSVGPRVFWTFRMRKFHNAYTKSLSDGTGERNLAFQDTWFPMAPGQWISLGEIKK